MRVCASVCASVCVCVGGGGYALDIWGASNVWPGWMPSPLESPSCVSFPVTDNMAARQPNRTRPGWQQDKIRVAGWRHMGSCTLHPATPTDRTSRVAGWRHRQRQQDRTSRVAGWGHVGSYTLQHRQQSNRVARCSTPMHLSCMCLPLCCAGRWTGWRCWM